MKNATGNVLHADGWTYDVLGRMSRQRSTTGTLDYAWDAGGNLSGVKSVTPGGYDLSYDYDALGRLTTVHEGQEGIDPASRPIAAYGYDANGNLAGVGYANGIQHAYAYDALNRLTGLNVARQAVGTGTPATPVQGYAYTLDQAGRRTGIAELGGRTVAHTFDALGRLTSETISHSQLSTLSSQLSYSYDSVGNRLSRTTTGGLTALLPNQAKAFTANDQLTSDSYDANGNTTGSEDLQSASSATDVYSFDNRLIRRTRGDGVVIDLTYNADGDRVSKRVTANGFTRDVRLYLVDRANPTGYAQVVEEKDHTGQLVARNLYGHDLIASDTSAIRHWYTYDGLGSVRGISSDNGDLQETYDYDAYGTIIGLTKRDATTGELVPVDLTSSNSALRTPNSEFLFTGEQWDADLGMYFLRARYLNPDTGRFHTQDTYEGRNGEPLTLHKYLYAHGNPVIGTDPSGNMFLAELSIAQSGSDEIDNASRQATLNLYKKSIAERRWQIFRVALPNGLPYFEHTFIWANDIRSKSAFGYHVVANKYAMLLSKRLGVFVPGLFVVVPQTTPGAFGPVRSQVFSGFLTSKQFLIWNAINVPLGAGYAMSGAFASPFDYRIPDSSCKTWSDAAAASAAALSLLPF